LFALGVEWSGVGILATFWSLALATSSVIINFASRKIQVLGHLCKVLRKSIWNGCFGIYFILSMKRWF
jgi:hypothetical protein